MDSIIVPIALFAAPVLIILGITDARRRAHDSTSSVIKAMVEKGETITPETIQALGVRPKPKHTDLRIGLILIALAIATMLFGGVIPEDEAQEVFVGLSMFPLLIGVVYVGLWALITRKSENGT